MIRIGRLLSCLMLVTGLVTSTARAQDAGKIGITMGYPASVGILWQAANAIAVRPVISFGGATAESTATASGTHNWSLGTTISALFYLKKYDNVRTYVSPSYRYSHSTTTITPSASAQPGLPSVDSTANTHGASGTFGAEYAPGSRARIYGEVGFVYGHTTTHASAVTNLLSTSGNTWGTTAGVGFVFYP
jgi:hypothetical protein